MSEQIEPSSFYRALKDVVTERKTDYYKVGKVTVISAIEHKRKTEQNPSLKLPQDEYRKEEVKLLTNYLEELAQNPSIFEAGEQQDKLPLKEEIERLIPKRNKILNSEPISIYDAVIKVLLKGEGFYGIGKIMEKVLEEIEKDSTFQKLHEIIIKSMN